MQKGDLFMKKKAFLGAVIAVALAVSGTVFASDADFTIDVMHGESDMVFENKPFIKNSEVYLPLRELMNKIDESAAVEWNGQMMTVSVKTKDNAYLLTINGAMVSVNPEARDAATFIQPADNNVLLENDRTYIPYSALTIMFKEPENPGRVNFAVFDDAQKYELAKVWAHALVTRDGKPRYDIMTEDMQKAFVEYQKEYISGEDFNYVIGYSSPWTVSYNIVVCDNKAQITYFQTDSSQTVYSVTEEITFSEENGKLCVSACDEVQRDVL